LTARNIEYMPIGCMLIDGHADQLNSVGEFQQRPERVLDSNSLSRGRLDKSVLCWLEATQKEIGLIDAASHYSCIRSQLTPAGQCLHPHLVSDEACHFKIPLHTGCGNAARSKSIQNAIGARTESRAPQWLFERCVQCG
jgi:hypothetical protein